MSRFRLHRSSLVVALASLLIALVIVVPGVVCSSGGAFYNSASGGGHVTWTEFAHGWPYRFLLRTNYDKLAATPEPLLGIPWLSSAAWAIWQAEDCEFSFSKLLADLLVVLIGICLVAFLWEWRRRRRARLSQIRLSELLLLTFLFAGALGWHSFQLKSHRAEQQHVRTLEGTAVTDEGLELAAARPEFHVYEECFAPTWLVRLVGEELLPPYMWHPSEIFYDPVNLESSDSFDQALPHIRPLKYVRNLSFADDPWQTTYPYSSVAELPQIRSLEIGASDPTWYRVDQVEARKIAELQQITSLVLQSPDMITPEAKKLLSERIPNCTIEYVFDE